MSYYLFKKIHTSFNSNKKLMINKFCSTKQIIIEY